MQSSTLASFGMLMVLEIAPEINDCDAAIMVDVAFGREIALANATAGSGAIEYRQMLVFQTRRAFQRHGPATIEIGQLNVRLGKSHMGQYVEGEIRQLLVGEAKGVAAEILAQRELVESEFDVEGRDEAGFQLFRSLASSKPSLGGKCLVVDAWARLSACRGPPRN